MAMARRILPILVLWLGIIGVAHAASPSGSSDQSRIDAVLPLNLKLYTASIDEEKRFAAMVKKAQYGRSKDPLLYSAFTAQKILQNNPNDLTANEILCDAYFQTGYMAAASKQCRDTLKINPDSALAKTTIADIAFRSGKPDAAEGLLREVLAQNKNYAKANLVLSEILKSRGEVSAAMSEVNQALANNPDAASLMAMGDLQMQSGQFDGAANSYLKVLQLDPTNAKALASLSNIYSGRGDYARALDFAQKAATTDPKSALAQYTLGTQYDKIGRSEEAIVSYATAAQLDPQFGLAHRALGIALNKKGSPIDAISELNRALQLMPGDGETLAALAQSYRSTGDNVNADRIMAQIKPSINTTQATQQTVIPPATNAPPSAEILTLSKLAKTAEANGQYEIARQYYEKMAIAEPTRADHYFNLGRIYAIAKQWDNAERFYKIAIERKPNYAAAQAELSKVQCFKGDSQGAWANYSASTSNGWIDNNHAARDYLQTHCPITTAAPHAS